LSLLLTFQNIHQCWLRMWILYYDRWPKNLGCFLEYFNFMEVSCFYGLQSWYALRFLPCTTLLLLYIHKYSYILLNIPYIHKYSYILLNIPYIHNYSYLFLNIPIYFLYSQIFLYIPKFPYIFLNIPIYPLYS
jgi:hypothetical protein